MRMPESAGICTYRATKHGPSPLAVDMSEADYGVWLNWQYFSDATLTFPQTIFLRYSKLEPEERRLPQAAEDYRKWFLGRLRIVESTLANRQYLAGGRFTTADISVGYGLMLAEILGLGGDFGPNVAAYWARLKERDGYRRALLSLQPRDYPDARSRPLARPAAHLSSCVQHDQRHHQRHAA